MSTNVPGEAMVIDERRSETPSIRILVKYLDSDVADLRQSAGRTQTGRPPAEDQYRLIGKFVHSRSRCYLQISSQAARLSVLSKPKAVAADVGVGDRRKRLPKPTTTE